MTEVKSELYNKIYEDLKNSMKEKNIQKRDVLKIIISGVKNETINNGKDITDEACRTVLKRLVKQHEDSIKQFTDAGRTELVAKEALELSYLRFYLPRMMSEEEMKSEINNIITVNRIVPSRQNMGRIMKIVKQYDNIDMKKASEYIKSIMN